MAYKDSVLTLSIVQVWFGLCLMDQVFCEPKSESWTLGWTFGICGLDLFVQIIILDLGCLRLLNF